MKKYKIQIFATIISILLTFFMWHRFLTTGNDIVFIFVFLVCYNIIKKTLEKIKSKRLILSASIISIILTLIEIICKSINMDFTLDNIINKWLPINIIGYFTIIYLSIVWIFNFWDNYKSKKIESNKLNSIELFFIVFTLIILAWIPYFLNYYPGIVTSDSYSQIEQTIGILEPQDHHPIAHTAIIGVCINIGIALFNNINTGIALYSIMSMILMAAFDSIVILTLRKKKMSKLIIVSTLLFYMFYPVNAIYSITMWKDILFSGIIPIFLILCEELMINTNEFFKRKSNIVTFVAITILTMLLRHNGVYVVILTLPFILIYLKKYWKKVLPLLVSILVFYEIFNIIMFNILKIEKGSIGEMLSIPLQQIARVEAYHLDELDDNLIAQINKMFKKENIGQEYNPIISDPVKAKFDDEYFQNNKGDFIKLWLKLLVKYPKDYIESFISNSYGYYYPEAVSSAVSRATMDHNLGITRSSKIDGKLIEKIDAVIDNRDIPLLSMMFSVGFGFWVIIVGLGYKIYIREYRYIILYIPIIVLWLTCIASPVFCEYRYAYPIFTTIPLYLSFNFIKNKEEMEKIN